MRRNYCFDVLKELGLDQKQQVEIPDNICQLDSPEILCGGGLWDAHHDHEQLEAMTQALRSTCELGFEKVTTHS